MKVKKIRGVFHFRQSPCLAKFIKYNADQNARAKIKLEKMFYKILIDAFNGKLIEKK